MTVSALQLDHLGMSISLRGLLTFFGMLKNDQCIYIQDLKPCNHATIQDQYCCIVDNMRHAWIQPNLDPCFIQQPGPSRKARRLAWQYSRGDPWHTCQDCGYMLIILYILIYRVVNPLVNHPTLGIVIGSTSFWVVYNAPSYITLNMLHDSCLGSLH